MKTVNLHIAYTDLDGKQVGNSMLGKSLANLLAMSASKEDYLKFNDWAKKLNRSESLKLDIQDFKKLKEFVENHDNMVASFRSQIVLILDEIKEDE